MKRIGWTALVLGCGPAVTAGGETSSGTSAVETFDDSGTTATTRMTSTSSAETTTAAPETSTGTETSDDPDDGSGFIPPSDVLAGEECDIWIDDCPPGFKCMPWANDGGSSWNATKCTPLAEDPNAPGEPCTVVGSGVSGVDDCEARAMCWDVDPQTDMGTCFAFCRGSEANPTCADPCTFCRLTGEGVLILCLPLCDPLAQDCGEGLACYPWEGTFSCAPDAGGDAGILGDTCEFLNVCDPGLFCADADSLPDCAGAIGCCSRLCDAAAADPCAEIVGTECVPFFDEFEQPPCYTGVVGGCLLPA